MWDTKKQLPLNNKEKQITNMHDICINLKSLF